MDGVGERVRLFRVREGHTQEDFGVLVGVTRKHISAIECGKSRPSMALLRRMADALGVSAADLLRSGAPRTAESFEDRKAHQQLQTILDSGGERARTVRSVLTTFHAQVVSAERTKKKAANN